MSPLDTGSLFTSLGPTAAIVGLTVGVLPVLVKNITDLLSARKDEREGRSELQSLSIGSAGLTFRLPKRDTNSNGEIGDKPTDATSSSETPPIQPVTFEALWDLTQKRINAYHKIATGQSKASFVSTQFVTYVGFALIVLVGFIAARATTTAGAVSAGAVGVIGGGLSAYISATAMKTQSEANQQLREFFFQPVEFARMLAAERLLEAIHDEAERSRTRSTMITAMMDNMISRPSSNGATAKPVKKAAKKAV